MEPASAVTNLAIIVAVFAVLERLLDGLWLEFWLAWGPGLSLPYKVLGAYSLKYKLWIHWRLLLDDFFMAFRLKPLQLSLEDVPLAHHNLYLEDWLYLEFRNYNYKTSVLSFMHEPYVAWAIRRAAEPLSLSVEESILNSRGRKKVI